MSDPMIGQDPHGRLRLSFHLPRAVRIGGAGIGAAALISISIALDVAEGDFFVLLGCLFVGALAGNFAPRVTLLLGAIVTSGVAAYFGAYWLGGVVTTIVVIVMSYWHWYRMRVVTSSAACGANAESDCQGDAKGNLVGWVWGSAAAVPNLKCNQQVGDSRRKLQQEFESRGRRGGDC